MVRIRSGAPPYANAALSFPSRAGICDFPSTPMCSGIVTTPEFYLQNLVILRKKPSLEFF